MSKREMAIDLVNELKEVKLKRRMSKSEDENERLRHEFEELLGKGEQDGLYDVFDLLGCGTWTRTIAKIEVMYNI